jgi:hypothetical protein
MLVWRWSISSLTIKYTWKFLLDNGYNKYNLFFEQIIDIETYDVKLCFVMHVRSNAKLWRIKHHIWCIVHITINCVQNLILVIMYNGLSPICVSLSIGV